MNPPGERDLHDPQALYRRWEESQWNPFEIDLALDRDQWPALADGDRELVIWALASLIVAEERITTKFSGLLGAHGSEEEATFLSTQQVDEARHMQFYARFQDEVVSDPARIGAHVARSREQLSPAFETIFDDVLVGAHQRLVDDPGDRAAKVGFVTVYHLVIESTLGLTAFEFITRYLEREKLLPGFLAGYSNIHRDEHRHIGYGVWFLRDALARDASLADSVREKLRELLPAVANALAPPGADGTDGADWEALGVSAEEVRGFALDGLRRRLAIVGVALDSL